jgi:Protein of unknown function (DUF2950)
MINGRCAQIAVITLRRGERTKSNLLLPFFVDPGTENRDSNGLREYATKFISTPGKHDGLYWQSESQDARSRRRGSQGQ